MHCAASCDVTIVLSISPVNICSILGICAVIVCVVTAVASPSVTMESTCTRTKMWNLKGRFWFLLVYIYLFFSYEWLHEIGQTINSTFSTFIFKMCFSHLQIFVFIFLNLSIYNSIGCRNLSAFWFLKRYIFTATVGYWKNFCSSLCNNSYTRLKSKILSPFYCRIYSSLSFHKILLLSNENRFFNVQISNFEMGS